MNPIEYLLTKVCEESGEVSQAAAKFAQFGPLSLNPKTGLTNLQELVKEFNDLSGVMHLLREELQGQFGLSMDGLGDDAAIHAKMDKVLHYARVLQRLGRLEPYDDTKRCPCMCSPCQCPPNLIAKRTQPND